MVEQPPPKRDHLAGQIGIDLIEGTIHADTGIAGDFPGFGLASKSTEPFPGAHLP